MPTARELLEQADALMRRNRSTAHDDIPVLTDSVTPAPEPPAARRTPVPPELPRTFAPDAREPEPDPIPTLTEPVHASTSQAADSSPHEGEPSDWLEFDEGEPSITGEAPDSIAIVPPVSFHRSNDDELMQSAEHEEIEVTAPSDERIDEEVEGGLRDLRMSPPSSGQPVYDESPAGGPAFDQLQREAVAHDEPQHDEPQHDEPPQDEIPQDEIPQDEPQRDEPPVVAAPPPDEPVAVLLQDWSAGAGEPTPAAAEAPPPTSPAQAAAAAVVDDQAHWDAVAEEVRMQVLQRIDIFTDTGLREQLGRRLQPIVDRASADLVATINLHVGELLRGYVAEAIEREIENWRKNN